MKRITDEELNSLKASWRLGVAAGKERRHLVGFEPWDYNGLCGVKCHTLMGWTEHPQMTAWEIRKLCPACRKLAKEKRTQKGEGEDDKG